MRNSALGSDRGAHWNIFGRFDLFLSSSLGSLFLSRAVKCLLYWSDPALPVPYPQYLVAQDHQSWIAEQILQILSLKRSVPGISDSLSKAWKAVAPSTRTVAPISVNIGETNEIRIGLNVSTVWSWMRQPERNWESFSLTIKIFWDRSIISAAKFEPRPGICSI